MENNFGGSWTENKIEIIVEYAKAYLTIMDKHAKKNNWKLLYFDGFAGSGFIKKNSNENKRIIIGAAKRVLEINSPREFDMFYFVEKEESKASLLQNNTKDIYPSKNIHIVSTDCNDKIESMSKFLKTEKGKQYKTLAYIDPCGMQLSWKSLISLQELSVDVWILIPTGMGVNRLLKKNGQISKALIKKLELFLGLTKEEILNYFYTENKVLTLFGEETKISKEDKAIKKSAKLYSERLNQLFKYVSEPYILKNKMNSTMFHFLMVSNNATAVKVANDIVKKYNNY
jgi:three-Cys-motif partner protein